MMRQPVVIANWKMNMSFTGACDFGKRLPEMLGEVSGLDLVICAPFVVLAELSLLLEGTPFFLGAQNMHWQKEGALTGEISPLMLREVGVKYVIIGHSERRTLFGEDDATVRKKIASAFAYGLTPIFCIGENWEQRSAQKTKQLLKEQLCSALQGLKQEENILQKLIIAYEPIWAIGTGNPAGAEDALDAAFFIRSVLAEIWGDLAQKIRVIYGGSVTPDNITEFTNLQEIDGALVGGSSLKVADFAALVQAVWHERRS